MLDRINGLKNDRIFKFSEIKRNHMVDRTFNEDPKNLIFSMEALISGDERPKNLGKNGQ